MLELNVLRVTGQLAGETPQQRFWSFVRHFARPAGLAALLAEYPVLARLLAQATEQAVASWLELLRRFRTDRPRLAAEVFGGSDPGRLVEVATGHGDPHQRGRSVAVLRFERDARLVYKPRPLAVHVHFNQCVDWLNQQLPGLWRRTLEVLDRGRYGWVEFADHRSCADRAGLARYYRRQGALLALLYALDGADFHVENLIASGDQPMLVDLEALLHSELPAAGPELLVGDPALAAYRASVGWVGLLPSLVFGEGGTALDLGGNGGDAGAPIPFKTAAWSGPGTDQMQLVRAQPPFPGSQNRPRLGDLVADATEFATELTAGFRTAYDTISANRDGLVGRLPRFATDELRVLARHSRMYSTLLYESTHPDLLRDALDRDRILDLLWAVSAHDPGRRRLVEHERADLWAGDLPLFCGRPDSGDIWTSDGTRLPEALAVPAIAHATNKIRAMDAKDRGIQEWIIEASLATRRATTGARQSPPVTASRTAATGPAGGPEPERALAAARAVGDRLAASAHQDGERVGWLGLHFVDEARWHVQPLGFDLYGGYPGVALFLSQLALLTNEDLYAGLAHRALAPVPRLVDELVADQPPVDITCAAFGSLPGLAYALVHVAANLDAPDLLTAVEPLLSAVASTVPDDEAMDVIGGSAGGLVAALAVHRATGLAVAREIAEACAERLVQTAKPQDQGVAWETAPEASQPLTGFSHGAAGVGWALLRCAAATGRRRYAEIGLDAFRYERSQYLPPLGNWPDFRAGTGSAMHAWCHGAPGIGLARADSGHLADPAVAADLALALRGLCGAPPDPNLSLCHGQLGNLELLTVVNPGSPEWSARAAAALASLEQSGPLCGTPGGTVTPGLMVGLAGIGHGLLRLGFPEQVPSVLLLQPPGAPARDHGMGWRYA